MRASSRRARSTPGLALELEVDHARRDAVRANHSATHILHEALRRVLGDHVAQKGSLVAPDRLRFDFTHPKPLTDEEIAAVERIANAVVQDNAPVETRLMAQDDAIHSGARALFGEKYGDEVRVVSMGATWRADDHIAPFRSSSAAAPMCAAPATSASSASSRKARSPPACAASRPRPPRGRALSSSPIRGRCARSRRWCARRVDEAPARLAALLEERKQLERELAEAKRKLAMGGGGDGAAAPCATIDGVKLFARAVSGIEPRI